MPRILRVINNEVEFEDGATRKVSATRITDRALGLVVGNELSGNGNEVAKFQFTPPGQADKLPDIIRNPYNQVPLGGAVGTPPQPWETAPPHPDHGHQASEHVSGWLECRLTLRTPTFVPEGFPAGKSQAEQLRRQLRHFSRFLCDDGCIRYCIPGSTLKGVIRSQVEQITNSRFGVFVEKKHSQRHTYRFSGLRKYQVGQSVYDLVEKFVRPPTVGLQDSLSLAERMFGFSGDHRKGHPPPQEAKESHPFRGLVSVGTAWGPVADSYEEEKHWQELRPDTEIDPSAKGFIVQLAPLTAPKTHAKARPLYLDPLAAPETLRGKAASFDDAEARFRGRKAYWHQNTGEPKKPIWEYHLYRRQFHGGKIEDQCPPPLAVLNAIPSNEFTCRIRFRNLSQIELGALVQALEGDDESYCLKIGKAKPRSLGSIRVTVSPISTIDYEARFKSFQGGAGIATYSEKQKQGLKDKFTEWQKEEPGGKDIANAAKNLGTFPSEPSVRYYPVNFSQYNWQPNTQPTDGMGKPKGPRPPAMKKAADLEP